MAVALDNDTLHVESGGVNFLGKTAPSPEASRYKVYANENDTKLYVVKPDGSTRIISDEATNRYTINSISDFPVPPIAGKLTLPGGRYFINPLLFIIPYSLDTNGTDIAIIDGYNNAIVYVGGNKFVDSPDASSGGIIFDKIAVVDGVGSASFSDVENPSDGDAIIVLELFGAVNFASMGNLDNVILLTDVVRFVNTQNGFTLSNMKEVLTQATILLPNPSASGYIGFDLQGTNQNVEFSSITCSPYSNQSVLNIDSASTVTAGAITLCTFDLLNGGTVFAPGSKDQTDLSWKATGNKNLQNSTTTVSVKMVGNLTPTPIVEGGAYVLVQSSTPFTFSLNEETTVDANGMSTHVATEPGTIYIPGKIVMDPSSAGTKNLSSVIPIVRSSQPFECTFSIGTPGIVNRVAHGRLTGDIISFYNSDTPPAILDKLAWYYVTYLTDDTFNLSDISGGTLIDFADVGSGTNLYAKVDLTGSFTPNSDILFNKPGIQSPDTLARVATGDQYGMYGTNNDDTFSVRFRDSSYITIKSG